MFFSHITNSLQVRNDLTFLDLTVQQIEYLNKKYALFDHTLILHLATNQHFTLKVRCQCASCLNELLQHR